MSAYCKHEPTSAAVACSERSILSSLKSGMKAGGQKMARWMVEKPRDAVVGTVDTMRDALWAYVQASAKQGMYLPPYSGHVPSPGMLYY